MRQMSLASNGSIIFKKYMLKKTSIIIGILIFIGLIIWSGNYYKNSRLVAKSGAIGAKLKVVTTLFPLYDQAKNIGGAQADVYQLLPPGVEAHSFEPKPSDIVRINEADIFIYTGKFMEPWVEDILHSVSNPNLIVVDASQGTKMIPGVFHDADEPAGSLDPHIWLDFDNAKIMASNINQAFIKKDSPNQTVYQLATDAYVNQLTQLDEKYRTALANCQSKKIIYGGHYAFGYLANRYGLEYFAAQGIAPDAEPTAADLIALVKQLKTEKIKYIFYEELSSPKIAQTIASESSAQMLLLNAAHNLSKEQFDSAWSFLEILENNLANLKIGLGCK